MTNNKYWVFGVEYSSVIDANPHMYCVDLLDVGNNIIDLCMTIDVHSLKTNWEEYLKDYIDLMDLRFGDKWRQSLNHKYPKIYYSVKDIEYSPEMYCVIQPDSGQVTMYHSLNNMLRVLCPRNTPENNV